MAWEGRAGQARIGHFIQGNRRTLDDIWELVEMKNPAQIEYGNTLWWLVANTTTGDTVPVPPKLVTARVRFMLTPEEHAAAEETRHPPHLPQQWPVDSEEILELVATLGATEIGTRDHATGEITCPNYAVQPWHQSQTQADAIHHLRIAHGIDVSGIEALDDWEAKMVATHKTHGQLHGPESLRLAHAGFPHRHVPEDVSFL